MLRFRWVLVISFVLGVLTTFATAWGLSWGEYKYDLSRAVFRTEESRPHRCLRIWRGFASTDTESWNSKVDYNSLSVMAAPYWSAAAERPTLPSDDDPHVERHEYAVGFPFRALMMHQDVVRVPTGLTGPQQPTAQPSAGEMQYAIKLTGWGPPMAGGRADRYLPYAPIWRGFLANTLMYGALYLLPLFVLSQRRRVARSRALKCTKCGYDIRSTSTARCPECSTGIPSGRKQTRDRWVLRFATALFTLEASALTTIFVTIVCVFHPGWSEEQRKAWMEENPARLLLVRQDGTGATHVRWKSDRDGVQYHNYLDQFNKQGTMTEREKDFLYAKKTSSLNRQRDSARVDPELRPWWAVQPPFPDDDRDPVNPMEAAAYGWPCLAFRYERVTGVQNYDTGFRGGLVINRYERRYGNDPAAVIPAIPIWRGLLADTAVFAAMWIALAFFARLTWRGVKGLRRRSLTRRGVLPRPPRTPPSASADESA